MWNTIRCQYEAITNWNISGEYTCRARVQSSTNFQSRSDYSVSLPLFSLFELLLTNHRHPCMWCQFDQSIAPHLFPKEEGEVARFFLFSCCAFIASASLIRSGGEPNEIKAFGAQSMRIHVCIILFFLICLTCLLCVRFSYSNWFYFGELSVIQLVA